MDLPADLVAFLRAGAARPFAWGECDCLLWLADWVGLRLKRPVGRAYIGRYSTATGCARLLKRAGGLEALLTAEVSDLGLLATSAPTSGDIGVARDGSGKPVGAIRVGERWAAKSPQGVVMAPFETLSAWSVPDA